MSESTSISSVPTMGEHPVNQAHISVTEAKRAFSLVPIGKVWKDCLLSPGRISFKVGGPMGTDLSVAMNSLQVDDYRVVDSKRTRDALVTLPQGDTALLTLEGGSLQIGTIEYEQAESQDWPLPTDLGEPVGEPFVLPPISKSLLAAQSPDDSRTALHGVFICPEKAKLVASNGHFMVIEPLGSVQPDVKGAVVSAEVMAIVAKMGTTTCQLYEKDSTTYAVLTSDKAEIITEVTPDFPDYEQVITRTVGQALSLPKDSLLRLLTAWQKVIKKDSRTPGIKCQGQGDVVEISAEVDGVKLQETVPLPGIGETLFGINLHYLKIILEAFPKEITLELPPYEKNQGQITGPMTFTGTGVMAVAMPMRVF